MTHDLGLVNMCRADESFASILPFLVDVCMAISQRCFAVSDLRQQIVLSFGLWTQFTRRNDDGRTNGTGDSCAGGRMFSA